MNKQIEHKNLKTDLQPNTDRLTHFDHWLADVHSGSFARPHSPCRRATVNAPANRQMPIASVVSVSNT
jgi:hypothetical protein